MLQEQTFFVIPLRNIKIRGN